jgi:hypothetical protein
MWVELYILLAVVVVAAYYLSLWDVARTRKEAIKRSEQHHLIDILKRNNQ